MSGELRTVAGLDRLHPTAVTDPARIEALLARLQREGVSLWRGMNRRIDPETATVESADRDGLLLQTRNFEPGRRDSVFLNFSLDGEPYFFSAPFAADLGRGRIRVDRPRSIYRAERRSRIRRAPGEGDAHRVRLEWPDDRSTEAEVEDASPEGMRVRAPDTGIVEGSDRVRIRLLDGPESGRRLHGEIRSRTPAGDRRGWTRIGLDVSSVPRSDGLRVERRDQVLPTRATERASRRWKVASAGVRVATDRALSALGRRTRLPTVSIVDYENDRGEKIRGIVDSWGDTRGATAVVIPPAWGRTKETLMPLAAALVAGFRAAGEPIVVLRFDGIRKRGESHNDPECRAPGCEHHHFTFSQGVRDIVTSLDFLEQSPAYRPRKTLLVSFSAASIESRRAVATDPRIDGWVCVVGAADTQSMMRVISGGVDFVAGIERGVSFGLQEVLGVEVDIDHAGRDLFEHSLPTLDDSRDDFGRIRVPVTWIHGAFDAWMDPDRARDVLSRGGIANRRFLEVPTGHMLKTSREALETFQLVAREASRIAVGAACPAVLPDLGELGRRQRAERDRLPRADAGDLRDFWRAYLVGTDGKLGIELMTFTSSYEELMRAQVRELDIDGGDLVLDLGSGTGAFPEFLCRSASPEGLRVLEIDYVRAGFARSRERLLGRNGPAVDFIESDLDLLGSVGIPIAGSSVDSVLASLFLSYVREPRAVLGEIHRILKPRGRLVLSTLRRDADLSKLYVDGLSELRRNLGSLRPLDGLQMGDLEVGARSYLNQAAKLLDLEEAGRFRFWDVEELRELIQSSGFSVRCCEPLFGEPPQAILISADRS